MKKLLPLSLFVVTTSSSFATTLNGFDATLYGFLKTSAMYSSEGLASYNNINMSAPTHAVAQTRKQDGTSRMSFQTQQTRVGVNLKKGEQLSSKFEFDFIDFNKSSPTTQMVPRVRIAAVTYVTGNHKFVIGQDWDLFSPVTSYTFDYVGLYFLAGNTGFMRQQAQYLNTQGNWEFGAALGMAGNNPGVSDADLELAKSPSYAVRATRLLENGRVGVSGIYARLNYESTNGTTHDSFAGNAFYEKVYGKFSVKSEAYYGKNLANIGALSIGKGTDSTDPKEYGGSLTGIYQVFEQHSIFGGVGLAKIDNKHDLAPYTLNTTTTLITAPGIRQNQLARVGWEYKVTPDFSWMSEVSRYETTSKITTNSYQTNVVYSLETGIQLRF